MNGVKNILIKIGQIQASILMGIIYYLIIGPMAMLIQLFHVEKRSKETCWIKREPIEDMSTYLKRQF